MVDVGHQLVILLPGLLAEFRPMMMLWCRTACAARARSERLFRTTLTRSDEGSRTSRNWCPPVYSKWPTRRRIRPPSSPLRVKSELHLVQRLADAAAASRALAQARDEILDVLGADVFSTDGRSMEEIVGELLLDLRGSPIAAAESCTGGLLLSRLTDIPGSSAYVVGGVVAVQERIERPGWGSRRSSTAHGAVSEPVAAALADGMATGPGRR